MVEVLDSRMIQLYEARLDNCLIARDRCEEDSWGWTFWQSRFTILLRRLNIELTGAKCYGSTAGSNPAGQGSIPCAPANKDLQ